MIYGPQFITSLCEPAVVFDPHLPIKQEPLSDDERERRRERLAVSREDRRNKRDTHQVQGKLPELRHKGWGQSRIKHEPSDDQERRRNDQQRRENATERSREDWGREKEDEKAVEKEKSNFGLSGKLAEETNTFKGVVIKYNEPIEARKPKRRWRLYVFKGEKELPMLQIHRQSAYLMGRERRIADIPIDHPSCSKQHAVLQFRLVDYTRPDGSVGRRVRPYIIDLESANGTYVNNKQIEPRRYVELFEKDVLKFGYSSREYVLLHEQSADDDIDEDVKEDIPEEAAPSLQE
ncbi:unnamed protein product [Darwinula stevensoni]|uniref:FHA domain-containing protein n=1 Tax=Darwinula stevensoni TaxID=69355 RepID=A0A7R9A2V8_9CRUS|nr:unnamed protein product [Darwinula stevensoni]CAG0880740.1 unnamed protein product [Darwinula stevensoni]